MFDFQDLELDHVVPVSDDLKLALDEDNLKPACVVCHRKKTDGEQSGREGQTRLGTRWAKVLKAPVRVAEEMTYDIGMVGPDHNFVANGLVVHNSYSEMSARYIQMPNLHYVPDPSRVQGQSTTNRQASAGALPESVVAAFRQQAEDEQQEIYDTYEEFLRDGVSRELARLNTPVSRYSRMVASANLLNWFRFLGLRLPEDAQWEIRQFSAVLADFIKQLFPRCWDLFEEFTLFSKRLSRTEIGDARLIVNELTKQAAAGLSTGWSGGDMEGAHSLLLRLQKILAA